MRNSTETMDHVDQAAKALADKSAGKYLTFNLANEEYGIGNLKIKEVI